MTTQQRLSLKRRIDAGRYRVDCGVVATAVLAQFRARALGLGRSGDGPSELVHVARPIVARFAHLHA